MLKVVTRASKSIDRPIPINSSSRPIKPKTPKILHHPKYPDASLVTIPKNPTTTILITTFNRSVQLKWGLSSLSKQKCKHKFDVLVINDAIPDDTEEICESFKDQLNIKYLFTGHRNLTPDGIQWRVPGFAFNIGVKSVSSDIIFLTCAEMYLINTDALELCIKTIISNPLYTPTPSGKDDGRKNSLSWGFESNSSSSRYLNHGPLLDKLNETGILTVDDFIKDESEVLPVDLPFFMGMARQHYVNIGGYDEDLIGVCADDNDLMYRLTKYGLIHYTVIAKMVHLWHPRGDIDPVKWKYNYDLYMSRKNANHIVRNKDREWGKLDT